jgi:hypothetical protein
MLLRIRHLARQVRRCASVDWKGARDPCTALWPALDVDDAFNQSRPVLDAPHSNPFRTFRCQRYPGAIVFDCEHKGIRSPVKVQLNVLAAAVFERVAYAFFGYAVNVNRESWRRYDPVWRFVDSPIRI